MSQPSPVEQGKLRWTGGSIALVVGGLELAALGLLAYFWFGRGALSPGEIFLLPIEVITQIGAGYVIVAGTALAIAGFVLASRPRAASQEEAPRRWNLVSAALFV